MRLPWRYHRTSVLSCVRMPPTIFCRSLTSSAQQVVRSIWAKPSPADLFGAGPNALAFNAAGDRLYVANGSQNAIGVIEFEADELEDSKLMGLIPVGWYPGAIVVDHGSQSPVRGQYQGASQDPQA